MIDTAFKKFAEFCNNGKWEICFLLIETRNYQQEMKWSKQKLIHCQHHVFGTVSAKMEAFANDSTIESTNEQVQEDQQDQEALEKFG